MIFQTIHFPELYQLDPNNDDLYYRRRLSLLSRAIVNCVILNDSGDLLGKALFDCLDAWPSEYKPQVLQLKKTLLNRKVLKQTASHAAAYGAPGRGCNAALSLLQSFQNVIDGVAPALPCVCNRNCLSNVPVNESWKIDPEGDATINEFENKRLKAHEIKVEQGTSGADFFSDYIHPMLDGSAFLEIHDANLGRNLSKALANTRLWSESDLDSYLDARDPNAPTSRNLYFDNVGFNVKNITWWRESLSSYAKGKRTVYELRIRTELDVSTLREKRPNDAHKAVRMALFALEDYQQLLNTDWRSDKVMVVFETTLKLSLADCMSHQRFIRSHHRSYETDRGLDVVQPNHKTQEIKMKHLINDDLVDSLAGARVFLSAERESVALSRNRGRCSASTQSIDAIFDL